MSSAPSNAGCKRSAAFKAETIVLGRGQLPEKRPDSGPANLLTDIWPLIQDGEIKRAELLVAEILRDEKSASARANVLLARARCKFLNGRPQEALEDWEQISALAPEIAETPIALELRADAHLALFELSSVGFAGKEGQAASESLYRQVIRQHPTYENRGWLHYQLGRVLLTANRNNEASVQFHQALVTPSNLPALNAYCYERLAFIAHYEERDRLRALGYLEKAIHHYPAGYWRGWLVEILLMRARVTLELGRLSLARLSIDEVLRLLGDEHPKKANALYDAAEILLKIPGEEQAVIPLLEEYLELSKQPLSIDVSWARAHERLGELYFRSARYDDAVSAYRQALRHNPYSPLSSNLQFQLACAQYQGGHYHQACETLAKLILAEQNEGSSISDYRVYELLGNAHFVIGNYDDSLRAYQNALALSTENSPDYQQICRYHDYALRRSTE